ncbi:hypothetical protein UYSO10_5637 [Kosakonia radicincitans]|nr:hypothetical protein UYSO10_5637 [Kosakonia radicincitans]
MGLPGNVSVQGRLFINRCKLITLKAAAALSDPFCNFNKINQ